MFSKLRTELSQSTGNLDPLMNGRQACAPRLHEDVAGLRGKRRKQLPAMSPEFIASCDAEIGRIIVQSGYCCRWVDEFQLLNGLFKIDGLEHVGVIHWNNGRAGMGKRIRPTGGSVVILQKPPIGVRAKRLAVRWKTLPMIRGIHYEK